MSRNTNFIETGSKNMKKTARVATSKSLTVRSKRDSKATGVKKNTAPKTRRKTLIVDERVIDSTIKKINVSLLEDISAYETASLRKRFKYLFTGSIR